MTNNAKTRFEGTPGTDKWSESQMAWVTYSLVMQKNDENILMIVDSATVPVEA